MHELGITENILDTVVKHAGREGAVRITDISLVIGDLSSVVDDSVQFYWDMLSAGTLAEGAQLHFHRIPAKFRCETCGHCFSPDGLSYRCPVCQSEKVRVHSGNEFYIDNIIILEKEDL